MRKVAEGSQKKRSLQYILTSAANQEGCHKFFSVDKDKNVEE